VPTWRTPDDVVVREELVDPIGVDAERLDLISPRISRYRWRIIGVG